MLILEADYSVSSFPIALRMHLRVIPTPNSNLSQNKYGAIRSLKHCGVKGWQHQAGHTYTHTHRAKFSCLLSVPAMEARLRIMGLFHIPKVELQKSNMETLDCPSQSFSLFRVRPFHDQMGAGVSIFTFPSCPTLLLC